MKLIWKTSLILFCSIIGELSPSSALAETQELNKSVNFSFGQPVDLELISPKSSTLRVESAKLNSFQSEKDLKLLTGVPSLTDDVNCNEGVPSCINYEQIQNIADNLAETKSPEQQTQDNISESTTPQETANECWQPIEAPKEAIAQLEETPKENTVEESSKENTDTSVDSFNGDLEQESEEQQTQETEKKEEKIFVSSVPKPTAEEIALYQQLAEADRYYRCGESLIADTLYKEAKKPFEAEIKYERELIPEAIYEPEYLQPGGGVYWRLYQQALGQKRLESKILSPLKLLTEQYPEFIPGHLYYAQTLKEFGKEEQAREALEHSVTLYPNEAPLVKAKIEADQAEKRWLDASLTARRFALFNPDHYLAPEFSQLANENLERYKNNLRSKLTWSAVGNAVLGGLGYALTGNIFGPLSAIETTVLLIQGEEAIGESSAKYFQKRLTMVEDEEVVAYVREIGKKLTSVAGRDEFDYEFFVVMDENLNAFALPGGKVFINAGAILKTNSEAELAGLLAHELSHAVLSHGFQLMTSGNLMANVTQFVPYLGSSAGDLIVLNYSRDMEHQADIFGTRLLAASGYAADGVRNLMVVLEQEDKESQPPAWLSTHPDTSDRVKYVEKMVVQERLNRYAYEGVERHWKIRNRVGKLLDDFRKEKEETETETEQKPNQEQLNNLI